SAVQERPAKTITAPAASDTRGKLPQAACTKPVIRGTDDSLTTTESAGPGSGSIVTQLPAALMSSPCQERIGKDHDCIQKTAVSACVGGSCPCGVFPDGRTPSHRYIYGQRDRCRSRFGNL